jgi:group I intron endonuclease
MNMYKSGIYRIKNLTNNKSYIGSSKQIEIRWVQHKCLLNKNMHYNPYLQNAWNKDSEINFDFSFIEECTEEVFEIRETIWINYYNSMCPNGYNIQPVNRINGKKIVTEETRKKLSESHKGLPLSEGFRKQIGNAQFLPNQKGKKRSLETRQKMSKIRQKQELLKKQFSK